MKIAVIGSGVSGMVAAYLLSEEHEVTVFEANDYIGGHTNTIDVEMNGETYPVDTGFIVFNELNYPNLVKLLKRLGVAWRPSNMSFSVQSEESGLEYSPSSLQGLFAQRRNLFRPSFYRMLLDVKRFRREALELLEDDDHDVTLFEYLNDKSYSKAFIHHFILPMGEAIWSADPKQFEEFPARYFVQFFKNHAFLNIRNKPQWQVVEGGSRQYIQPLTKPYRDRVRLNCPVVSVTKGSDHVGITLQNGETERFDQAIIAAHSNQALAMLSDPSDREREILESMPYQHNETVLHTDASLLPSKRCAWASWNYLIPRKELGRVALTYDMNILQSIDAPVEFCVTLNLRDRIDPDRILSVLQYEHPVYTPNKVAAQKRHGEISGVDRLHFCGAYWGYGFHEDGVSSALAVCKYFGKSL